VSLRLHYPLCFAKLISNCCKPAAVIESMVCYEHHGKARQSHVTPLQLGAPSLGVPVY
jgi:hypothetical protein